MVTSYCCTYSLYGDVHSNMICYAYTQRKERAEQVAYKLEQDLALCKYIFCDNSLILLECFVLCILSLKCCIIADVSIII